MPGYINTTRGTLRQRVRDRLLSTFWSDTELNAYINEALRIWNVLTGYNRTSHTPSFSANTFLYDVSTIHANAMFVLRLESAANNALPPVTVKELDNLDINWVGRKASTPTNWMQIGANKVYLYPTPTGTYRPNAVYTVDRFAVPATDGDFVQVGEEDLQYVVDYCVFIARLKEGGKEAQEAVALLQGFLAQAAKYNAKIIQTSLYKRVMGIAFQQQARPSRLDNPTVR